MKTSLSKNLTTKEDKDEIRGQFIAALRLRMQIIDLIKEKIDSYKLETLSKEGYGDASWAYKQADANGYERAMREIISLLEK